MKFGSCALIVCAVLLASGCSTPDAVGSGSRPLAATEVEALYSDRTWKWETGGAFFAPDHELRAWGEDDRDRPGFVIGTWRTTDAGLLCFRGAWQFPGMNAFGESCFRHRLADGTVYQREEPAGSWYVLKSEPEHPDDPYREIVPGDRVSGAIRKISLVCGSPFTRCPLILESTAIENPLQAQEIRDLVSGRTWLWPQGGSYFAPGGWFQAWSADQSGTRGYAIGSWTATDAGLLCLEGAWRFGEESTSSRRCFGFRKADGNVYQRQEPAGDWYLFKSAEASAEDEYDNFVRGNLVAQEVKALREN